MQPIHPWPTVIGASYVRNLARGLQLVIELQQLTLNPSLYPHSSITRFAITATGYSYVRVEQRPTVFCSTRCIRGHDGIPRYFAMVPTIIYVGRPRSRMVPMAGKKTVSPMQVAPSHIRTPTLDAGLLPAMLLNVCLQFYIDHLQLLLLLPCGRPKPILQ